MRKLIVYQIDSFTKEKFKGNPVLIQIQGDAVVIFRTDIEI